MSAENRERQVDQLLRGIYRLCAGKDSCTGCTFYNTKCLLDEPKPSTWFDEEPIVTADEPVVSETKVTEAPAQPAASAHTSEPDAVPAVPAVPAAIAAVPAEAVPAPEKPVEQEANTIVAQPDDDAYGTWIVSTTMGNILSKYVYICSKCGYKKESFFSITPMSLCPECEKRKLNS